MEAQMRLDTRIVVAIWSQGEFLAPAEFVVAAANPDGKWWFALLFSMGLDWCLELGSCLKKLEGGIDGDWCWKALLAGVMLDEANCFFPFIVCCDSAGVTTSICRSALTDLKVSSMETWHLYKPLDCFVSGPMRTWVPFERRSSTKTPPTSKTNLVSCRSNCLFGGKYL